jgi:hypothetical protein
VLRLCATDAVLGGSIKVTAPQSPALPHLQPHLPLFSRNDVSVYHALDRLCHLIHEILGAASQDPPPIQKMSRLSIFPQILSRSSLSTVGDSVARLGPWVQVECQLTFCLDGGPCAAVENKPIFSLIPQIRRDILRRRNGRGVLTLFIPTPVDIRRISDIDGNTRYGPIWVAVLMSGSLSMKKFMKR